MDSRTDDAPSFPPLAAPAALVMWCASIALVATVIQIWAVFVFYDTAWRWIPVPLLGCAIASFVSARALSDARKGSAWLGALVSWLSAAVAMSWAAWAAWNGSVSAMPVLSALLCLVASVLALASIAPLRRYHQRLDALLEEVHAPDTAGTGARTHWIRLGVRPLVLRLAAGALLASGVLWAVTHPLSVERTWLRTQLLVHGQWPDAAAALVGAREDYGYDASPWNAYASYESRWTRVDTDQLERFADEIAEEVAWRLLLRTGGATVAEAERALWEQGDAEQLPLWIAQSLRARDVFYHQESLLSRAFDPALHRGDQRHLDCDLLVHLFVHVAWRLDLDFREFAAPVHLYLGYAPPRGSTRTALTVETTAFRTVDVADGQVNFLGADVGASFFVPSDWYATGRNGTWASDDLVRAARLYAPQSTRDVEDSIVANVLAGLEDQGIRAPTRSEALERLRGTHSYVLVSNLWREIVTSGEAALRAGDLVRAMEDGRLAVQVSTQHPHLILEGEPRDHVLFASALVATGEAELASAVIAEGLGRYTARVSGETGRPIAADAYHAKLLLLDAETGGLASVARCAETLGAVRGWLDADRPADAAEMQADLCSLASGHPEQCDLGSLHCPL